MMVKFNPDNQVTFARDPERCFFGMAPSLALVGNAYGTNTALSWLQIQLNDLSEFAGCRNKLSLRQIRELAAIIMQEYAHYRLTELMLFFQNFKRCRYGRFYGAVDPMVIMQALGTFDDERADAIDARRSRDRKEQEAEDDSRLERLRQRYIDRIPAAFTDAAPVDFLQYRLMGFDRMDDARLAAELADITSGRKTIPRGVFAILGRA